MKENQNTAVVFIRNRQEVTFSKTAKGFDVSIKGRWQGQDSEIFLALKYIGEDDCITFECDENSYMKGFRTKEPDFYNSPVTEMIIGQTDTGTWMASPHQAVTYTRAQRKLVPQVVETIMPMLPANVEDQKEVQEIEKGFQFAVTATETLRRGKELLTYSEEKFEEACALLKLDRMGVETLVVLGQEGGDIHLLAKSMDALLR